VLVSNFKTAALFSFDMNQASVLVRVFAAGESSTQIGSFLAAVGEFKL